MSSDEVQTSAFPEIVPEAPVVRSEASQSLLVPRTPGWVLVANRGGPQGFHRVKTVGVEGSVRTMCGITGRPITDSERMIVPCAACQAVVPA